MKHKKVTIKDIARIAGVSHSTVSRSLNDSPLISPDTKTQIQQIARELKFEFNASARSLSTSRTGTVGTIYPELFETFGNTLYLGLLMTHIRHSLEEASLDNLGTFPVNTCTGESNIQKLIKRKKIDGLIIIHSEITPEDWQFILDAEIPFVVLHFKPRNQNYEQMNYFFTDHLSGGYQAAEHLLSRGCRNILTLTENSRELQFKERTEGYRKALKEAGIPVRPDYIIGGDCSFEFGYEAVMRNRHLLDTLDGIFAQADIMALGAIDALRVLGIRVPVDIKVVGYDDTELGKYFRPRLTTIHQPREAHAKAACARLIDLLGLGGKDQDLNSPVQMVLTPTLVIRESCSGNHSETN